MKGKVTQSKITPTPPQREQILKPHELLQLAHYLKAVRPNMPVELDAPIGYAAWSLEQYAMKRGGQRS